MLVTPYTKWTGDDDHGRSPVITMVGVRLGTLYPRQPDAPRRVVPDGLDVTGTVPGRLTGWLRTVDGDWLGVVNFEIPHADGRKHQVPLLDQLIPVHALRRMQ
jgi:hypothetical protein